MTAMGRSLLVAAATVLLLCQHYSSTATNVSPNSTDDDVTETDAISSYTTLAPTNLTSSELVTTGKDLIATELFSDDDVIDAMSSLSPDNIDDPTTSEDITTIGVPLYSTDDDITEIDATSSFSTDSLTDLTSERSFTTDATAETTEKPDFDLSTIASDDLTSQPPPPPSPPGLPGDPDAVVLRSVDSSSLSLTWSNPESSPAEIVSYNIDWNSTTENINYTEGNASYTFPISDLDPGTEYEVTIKSVGEAGSSPGVSRTASTYPESPESVWIKSENTNGLEIEWDEAVGGADAYNVLVQRADFSLSETLNATSAFLTLPVSGGSYNVSVFTEFNNLTSEYPATVSARTVPLPPGNISCTPHNATSLMISLQTPEGNFEAEQFRVTYSIQEDDVDEIEGDFTEPVQVVLASLVPGTEYDIEGFLVIDNLTSEAVATQCSTLLDAATLLRLSDVNETSLNASWENPEGSYDALELWCQESSPGALGDLVTIPRNGPTHAVCSGLTSGALFEASVNTTQTNQSSVQSNSKWVATAPLLPTAFNVAGSSSDALNLTFNYDHGSDVSQCFFYIVNVSSSVYTISCSDTELLIPRLGSNWLHDVQLTVMSNYSEGVSSVSEEGIIQGWTLPSNRLNPNITDIESRQFSVAWISPENPQNVAAYHLYVMNVTNDCLLFISLSANESMDEIVPLRNCDGELSEIFDPGNLTYLVGGLTPYEQYSVRISAMNPGGVGTEAATKLTFTDEDTPGCVDLQSAEFDAGFDSIGIEWNSPNQPNGIITKYTIVYQMEGGNETLSNETDTNEIVIHELRPFTSYEFTVLAHTRIGEGEICDESSSTQDTKIGVPHPAVNVQAIAIDAHSIKVSWDMEHDVSTGPITYFTVTAMEHHSSFEEVVQLEGFHNRETVVGGLNAFRNYTVEVVTFVNNETNSTYSTTGKDAAEAMTLPSPSGPVNFFRVESIQGECYRMLAEWSDPIGYNRTGQVKSYQVSWIEDGETKKEYFLPSVNFRGHIDPLDPNDVEYEFKMRVENEDVNELGEPFTSNTESTGRCGPIPPSDEGVGVITPTQSEFKSKSKIVIQVDARFIDDSRNGALDLQGIIIGDAADNLIDEMLEISHEQLNVTFHPWSVAIKESPVRVFRATPDDWHPTSLLQSGSNYEVTIGDDESCDRNNAEVYCNGPLNSGRTYKARAVICTKTSCLVTKYALGSWPTESGSNVGMILGVVFGLLIVAFIAAAVVFVMRKRRGHTPATPVSQSNGGHPMHHLIPQVNEGFTADEDPDPIDLDRFTDHVKTLHMDSDFKFSEEYEAIKRRAPRNACTVAELQCNRTKNRFTNILPFDHSRVKLLPLDDDDEGSDYINANYMPGYNSKREFIACQGPMKSTIDHFWRMVWEQNVVIIVMVTKLEERGKEKCAQYWPADQDCHFYGDLQVQMRSESILDSYAIRIFDVGLGETTRTIQQFHFLKWPDFDCPDNTQMLLNFVDVVRGNIRPSMSGPVIVHCSAGVGRTGTFICVDRLLQHVKDHNTIDVFGTVLEMRNYRCNMIQTEVQYIFVHDCMRDSMDDTSEVDDQTDEHIYENVPMNKD